MVFSDFGDILVGAIEEIVNFITNLTAIADSALSVFSFNFWSDVSKNFYWVIVAGNFVPEDLAFF